MQFVRNALLWRGASETAERWTAERWDTWLANSSRIFFLAAEPRDKRKAFKPFLVEPILVATRFSDQLFYEIQGSAPTALPIFAQAVLKNLDRWQPQDGEELARFLLQLVYRVGGFIESPTLFDYLHRLINRLGPPLTAPRILAVLAELVECAIGRMSTPELRRLGTIIAQHANLTAIQPWQAQALLLDALIRKDAVANLINDIMVVAPTLPDIVMHNHDAKRFLADSVVDSLTLAGVATLMQRNASSLTEMRILATLRHCIFPYRVSEASGFLRDQLYGTVFDLHDGHHKDMSDAKRMLYNVKQLGGRPWERRDSGLFRFDQYAE